MMQGAVIFIVIPADSCCMNSDVFIPFESVQIIDQSGQ